MLNGNEVMVLASGNSIRRIQRCDERFLEGWDSSTGTAHGTGILAGCFDSDSIGQMPGYRHSIDTKLAEEQCYRTLRRVNQSEEQMLGTDCRTGRTTRHGNRCTKHLERLRRTMWDMVRAR